MGKMKTAIVGEEINENKHKKGQKDKDEKVHLSGLKGGQRVKMVESDAANTSSKTDESKPQAEAKPEKKEHVRGKKYTEAKAKLKHDEFYKIPNAVKIVKEASYSKFDETMELHLVMKKPGISVQVSLPNQAGKQKKIEVANEDTIKKLKEGKIDFDVLVATSDMMPKLVPFARLLGPKGLMPNPKNGTLVNDIKKAKSFSTATITLKTEREAPLIHTVVGKVSQKNDEIVENIEAILKALGKDKQIVRAFLKSTMSPSAK